MSVSPMAQLARNAARLEKIGRCERDIPGFIGSVFSFIFFFENGERLALSIDNNTDELFWDELPPSSEAIADLSAKFPFLQKAYGRSVAWVWEMRNHQGAFDALQMEFAASGEANTVFQFKVAASTAEIFELHSVGRLPSRVP